MKPLWLFASAAVAAFAVATRKKRGRVELVFLGLVVTAMAVYGAGLVELPNVKRVIADLGQALGPYTYVLVALGAFLETGAFVGLIAPGETTMIVGGVIAGQGEIRLGPLIAIVWVAAVAGDTVSFFLGRRLGREFLLKHGPRVQITEERLLQVEKFLERRGGTTILLGRFVGVVRAVAPFVLGASRMSYKRFIPYDILGAGLWAAFFTTLGYVFWQSFDRVAAYAGRGAFALGTVIVITVGTILLVRQLRDHEGRAQARAWLNDQLERPLLRPFAPALRWIGRRVLLPVAIRLRGPVWFAIQRVTPGGLGLEFTTVMAVLAVGTFIFIELVVVVTQRTLAFGDQAAIDLTLDLRTPMGVDAAEVVTVVRRVRGGDAGDAGGRRVPAHAAAGRGRGRAGRRAGPQPDRRAPHQGAGGAPPPVRRARRRRRLVVSVRARRARDRVGRGRGGAGACRAVPRRAGRRDRRRDRVRRYRRAHPRLPRSALSLRRRRWVGAGRR